MKVAIDISPLSSGHKVRGVGFYLHHLKDALEKYFPNNEYLYFSKGEKIPSSAEIVHYPYFDPFLLTLPFFKKIPTVITIHDLTPLVLPSLFPAGLKGKAAWLFQKGLLKSVNAVITDSHASKEDIEKIAGYPGKNIHVVHLAAGEEFVRVENQQRKKDVKKKYNLPDRFTLYVGDGTPNKNLPRLAKAALRAHVPLVMAGKALAETNIPKSPWTKDILEVQRLADNNANLIRLGFIPQEDLVVLYNLATVFVMPSLYEGFGLPILEAMSTGCPVVTSHEGSLKEVAGDGAYIVDAYSIESITDGIQKVVGDSKVQKKLREKGFIQNKKYSWKKTAEETVKVYKKVLSLSSL